MGAIGSSLLKLGFARPRPDIVAHLVDVNSASFPSGHAMNSAVVYLTLGALLARTHLERGIKIYILTVAITLTLMIGSSRVYLGAHWPSDVLARWIVGAIWAVLCSIVARRLHQNATLDSATRGPPGESDMEVQPGAGVDRHAAATSATDFAAVRDPQSISDNGGSSHGTIGHGP